MGVKSGPTYRTFAVSFTYNRSSHKPTETEKSASSHESCFGNTVTGLAYFSSYAVYYVWVDTDGENK